MVAEFLTFRLIDRIQIILFILFSAYICICLLLAKSEKAREALISVAVWLKEIRAKAKDDDPYDRRWMDFDKWEETRP